MVHRKKHKKTIKLFSMKHTKFFALDPPPLQWHYCHKSVPGSGTMAVLTRIQWMSQHRVHSHAPSIRSHRGIKVVWPDFQPMRVPEEPVCVHLFRQKPVFTSLHLKSPVHVHRLRNYTNFKVGVPPWHGQLWRSVCTTLLYHRQRIYKKRKIHRPTSSYIFVHESLCFFCIYLSACLLATGADDWQNYRPLFFAHDTVPLSRTRWPISGKLSVLRTILSSQEGGWCFYWLI